MTYQELLAACTRAVGAQPGAPEDMHAVVMCLMAHVPSNRAITAEVLCRFMAEFIEGQAKPATRPH